MNPDSSAGRIMSVEEAIKYYEAIEKAEEAMGPLSHEEKLVILSKFGDNMSMEDLVSILRSQRVLVWETKKPND
jgi:hypothetical protein